MSTRKPRGRIGRIFLLLAAIAMIVAAMPLAGAAANGVEARTVDLIADGRADAPDVPIKVGEVKIWNDQHDLYVEFVMDPLAEGDWCMTKTHVAVESTYIELPQTKKNLAIPGKFEYSGIHPDCDTTVKYEIPMTIAGGTEVFVAVHANVTDMDAPLPNDPDAFNAALPDTVTMTVAYPGGDSYFNTTVTNGGELDGTYDAWCVDIGHTISPGATYTADVYSSFDELPDDINIDKPENMDLVNWLINNYAAGDPSVAGGNFTMCDIQRAIWTLIDLSIAGCGDYNQARVNELVAAATANGGEFEPTECGQFVAVVLVPTNGAQTTITQTTFLQLDLPCEYRGETAWGGNWVDGAFEEDFYGKGWAGYFTYTWMEWDM